MIVGYVGSSDRLDIALARFARLYADQTEADDAALVKAAHRGIVPVEHGLCAGQRRRERCLNEPRLPPVRHIRSRSDRPPGLSFGREPLGVG